MSVEQLQFYFKYCCSIIQHPVSNRWNLRLTRRRVRLLAAGCYSNDHALANTRRNWYVRGSVSILASLKNKYLLYKSNPPSFILRSTCHTTVLLSVLTQTISDLDQHDVLLAFSCHADYKPQYRTYPPHTYSYRVSHRPLRLSC